MADIRPRRAIAAYVAGCRDRRALSAAHIILAATALCVLPILSIKSVLWLLGV